MISNGIIYYLNLTIDEFNELAKKGPFFKLGDLTSKVSKTPLLRLLLQQILKKPMKN